MGSRLSLLALVAFAQLALAQMPGPPPEGRFSPGDTTGRFGPGVADSLRPRREFEMLCHRLDLDSAQKVYVRNVLDRRNRLLRSQREGSMTDGTALRLRTQKVMDEADRDIGRKLTAEQAKEYKKYVEERQQRAERKRERRGPESRPGGPEGRPEVRPGGRGGPQEDW